MLYLFVSFVACVTPGSGVLYTIASGFRGGMKCVLASPLGTCLGCSLMSALSATGLGALIANSPAAYSVLQVGSALVLVWFGLQSWRSGALDLSDAGNSAAREGLRTSQERLTFRKNFLGRRRSPGLQHHADCVPPFTDAAIYPHGSAVPPASGHAFGAFCARLLRRAFGLQLDRRCRRQASGRPKVLFLAQPHQRRSFLAACGERYLERLFQELIICVSRVRSAADPCPPALQPSSLTARFGGPSRASLDADHPIWKNTDFLKGRKQEASRFEKSSVLLA